MVLPVIKPSDFLMDQTVHISPNISPNPVSTSLWIATNNHLGWQFTAQQISMLSRKVTKVWLMVETKSQKQNGMMYQILFN